VAPHLDVGLLLLGAGVCVCVCVFRSICSGRGCAPSRCRPHSPWRWCVCVCVCVCVSVCFHLNKQNGTGPMFVSYMNISCHYLLAETINLSSEYDQCGITQSPVSDH